MKTLLTSGCTNQRGAGHGNLKVLADMDAGMAHLHYAYLDYIGRQCTPFTSTDEWLAGWMA
ncbi:hypothetical protein ACPZ8I_30855, partial [Klebsiella variicola subsp. variicola]